MRKTIIAEIFTARKSVQGGVDMRTLVKEYILAKGNSEATEILQDYVNYLHNLGYVIRRESKLRQSRNTVRNRFRKHSAHLQPGVSMRSNARHWHRP